MIKKLIYKFFVFFMFFSSASSSFASVNWQMGFNESVTTVMNDIVHLHDRILLPIIVAISVFVLFLLLYSIFKFRASKNPIPSKTSHNTFIEVMWTVIPCLILIVIAVPSFRLLYKQDIIPKADVTIKAIGYQWYWGRINETWFKAEKEGVYYGQCSELCGSRHAFMPITVRVVSDKQYNEWLKEAKIKFAKYPENNLVVENLIKEKK